MAHTHTLKPDRPVKPTVFGCTSCEFRCTPRAVERVNANPRAHRVVKARKGLKPRIWDIPG